MFIPDLRIRIFSIPYPGSEIYPSRIPDPKSFHPGSESMNLCILTPKWFLSSWKYDLGCSTWIRIPDPDPDILPIPDPEVERHRIPDPQHWFMQEFLFSTLVPVVSINSLKVPTFAL